MIEWTSATLQGDEVMEWQDTEVSPEQHHVYIGREPRGLPDISFHFETQEEAHALYLALCRCKRVHVESDKKPKPEPEASERDVARQEQAERDYRRELLRED